MRRPATISVLRTGALVLALALAASACAVRAASAQGLGFGVLDGVITDAAGRPVAQIAITLLNVTSGRRQFLTASRDGRFSFGFLPPGRYEALFERLGYAPVRVTDIVVLPGQRVSVPVRALRSDGEQPARSTTVAPAAATGTHEAAPQRWLTSREAAALPFEGLGLGAIGLLSSRTGPLLDVEGLPPSMNTFVVDGVPAARRPRALGVLARGAGFPLSAFDVVDLVTEAPDVEWPGAGSAYFTAFTRQGSRMLGASAFGDWGGDALGGSGDAASFQSYRAGAQVGGPIVRDTAHFILGAELLRSEVPYRSLWAVDPQTAALVAAASDRFDVDLERYAAATTGTLERFSAYGRLDLRLGESHDLSVRGNAAVLPRVDPILPRGGLLLGPGAAPEARDIFGSATLTSRLSDALTNEVNAGFELGRYDRDATASEPPAIDAPATAIAEAGHVFGWADGMPQRTDVLHFFLRETVHDQRGSHRLKYGISGSFPMYKISFERGNAGEFAFGSISDFLDGRGALRRTEGVSPRADLSFRSYTFYAQDTWEPSAGLEITAGLRYGLTRAPDSDAIRPATDWLQQTGLRNDSVHLRPGRFEPLFSIGFAPDGGRVWAMRLSAVVDGQIVSPEVLGEVFSNSGQVIGFAGVGDLGAWPQLPDTFTAPRVGPTLSMLGPRFRGPQTARVSASFIGNLGSVGTVGVNAVYRRTAYLPRRRDLNLLPSPASFDQHGRPVYGELVKIGGLLAARPSTNRRLIEFDRVWALEASGLSTYQGLTVSLRRPLADAFALHAAYTYSRTEDNWPGADGADPDAQLNPFPDSVGGADWSDGVSDFDVPHRLVLGAELKVPGTYGPRLAGLYRFQAGYPFTPGFRDGVDVNADGSGRNDPAFIDNAVSGVDQLISSWSCLASRVGSFVERNSCRGPNLHALDARLSIDILRGESYSAQFVLDGINLIASDAGEVDRAVYFVDPASDLGANQLGGDVIVPLLANPDFGKLRTRYTPERMIRLGLRVSY